MSRSDDVTVNVELHVEQEQESEPPDTRLAVIVALLLLEDFRGHLEGHSDEDGDREDLLLRAAAVIAVLRRVRERLEE